ncbi:MAG: hypothetical protein CMH28_10210 [Micavibrio sp.]|nr:hypothetical protein [Micavibrio sp.]
MVNGTNALFEQFSLAINLGFFLILAASICIAGTRISYLVDAIAEQTKIARAFLGLILLATATELPEMVTTLTASLNEQGNLALNNMFGGMLLQLAVLAIVDIFVIHKTMTSFPKQLTPVMAGLFLIISLSTLLMFSFTGDFILAWNIGLGSCIIAAIYVLATYSMQRFETHAGWSLVDVPDDKNLKERNNRFDEYSRIKLFTGTAIAAIIILISGALVVSLAETLAEQTGLGTSFIGASLLALTTSLPELSTSLAAVKVRAYTMAITNIMGSNLIMTFLVFPVDIFFRSGAVINEIGLAERIALGSGVILTAIYCLGLLIRPRRKIFTLGIDSALILVGYILSLLALYMVRA